MRCDKCRFWEPCLDYSEGFCLRNAPSPVQVGIYPNENEEYKREISIWPVTIAIDWCGEFQKKLSGEPL